MIIDGPGVPSTIWKQTVNVVAGNTYRFSFWAVPEISTNNIDFPVFNMAVDGLAITASFTTAGSPDNEWSQYCTLWQATTTGSVTIQINQTGGFGGFNDYGIDDIEFCTETTKPCEVDPDFNFNILKSDQCTANFSDLSVAISGTIISWSWDFDDPTSGANQYIYFTKSVTYI